MNKTIGILGGMSAVSTQIYYRYLCDIMRERFGGLVSPQLLIRSVNFAEFEVLLKKGDWQEIGAKLNREARALERAGAKLIVVATNTMHMVIDDITRSLSIPHLHIADATARALLKQGMKRPAFLATAYSMSETFYTDKLRENGLEPMLPERTDYAELNRIIFDELCSDNVREEARQFYLGVVNQLKARGADSLILGCTELGMLLNTDNSPLPVFDTTYIHCAEAIQLTLS